jgi:hypothetical protein
MKKRRKTKDKREKKTEGKRRRERKGRGAGGERHKIERKTDEKEWKWGKEQGEKKELKREESQI